jgi:UDP-N-acetylmuramyl tripeptide synthase
VAIAGQTFTVNQAAFVAPCSYSIAPTSQSVPVLGGTGTVTVTTTSACAWTATSNAPWLSITSGANGTGSGTVGFAAAANIGAQRTGTLTIAGQTFTVTQPAVLGPVVSR